MSEWRDLTETQKEETIAFIAKRLERQYVKLEKRYGAFLSASILFKALSEIFQGRTYLAKKQGETKK